MALLAADSVRQRFVEGILVTKDLSTLEDISSKPARGKRH